MDTMLVLVILLTTTATLLVQSSNGQGCHLRVCYFNDYAQYRPTPETKFLPEDIDPTLCSHIIYNNVYLSGNDVANISVTGQGVSAVELYERVLQLKEEKSNLKVFLAVDGFRCDGNIFFKMSGNETSRSEFIDNIIKYLRKHKFDGLNLRCHYFGHHKVAPEIKKALSNLIAEMMHAFGTEATTSNRLLLSLEVYGERIIDDTCYDIPSISQNVDWINFLAFDLHGYWYNTTGHHSPIFAEPSKGQLYSVDLAVRHWRKQQTPRQKIVVVLPSFGKSYTLTGKRAGEGAPARIGAAGSLTRQDGTLAYYEICSLIQDGETALHRLTKQRVPYLVSGNQWVGYDDVHSVIARIVFVKNQRLGGFAFTYLDSDDFKGAFCGQGPYPLLKTANNKCDM